MLHSNRTLLINMAQEHPSVTLFRDYLRIKTVQPDPDYDTCMVFLAKIAKELDLPFQILEPVKGKPVDPLRDIFPSDQLMIGIFYLRSF